MQRDVKEVIGVLMRVLDGDEVSVRNMKIRPLK